MPFAHCTACGSRALIDPTGRCPEGHAVGVAAGTAIGVADERPHPDEPTPWVGTVVLATDTPDEDPAPRTVRPPSLTPDLTRPTGADATVTTPAAPAAPAPAAAASDSHELLRELQALGELAAATEVADHTADAVAPAPDVVARTRPTPLAVPADAPAPPSSPEEATEIDELAMLTAVIESLDGRPATPTPDRAVPAARHSAPAPTTPPVATPARAPRPTTSVADDRAHEETTELPSVARELAPVGATPLLDGNFTARGNGRRGGGRHGTSRRTLFRR